VAKGKTQPWNPGNPVAASPRRIGAVLKRLAAFYPDHPLQVKPREPFQVLVGVMLSSRTKDPVTNAAMERLWQRASTPQAMLAVPVNEIAELIKPVGFYRNKAMQLRGLSQRLLDDFNDEVPQTREKLIELPGVGRKVANLVLGICFEVSAICVDTHVHRISNRLGWVSTATPEKTEIALMEVVPKRYWLMLNRVLVNHGQQVCNPVSPRCSACDISHLCQRRDVARSR
jgi:endonuclease-3